MTATAVRSGYVMNRDNPVNYLEWGDPNAPCLVFLNTIRGAAYYWRPVAERLHDRYRFIGLNLRGHGDSGPMLGPHCDPDLYVSDVAALVTQLELQSPVLVVWAQFISGVGVRFAADHPELLRSLVVVDGGVGLDPATLPTVRQRLAAVPAEFDTWEEAVTYYRASLPPLVKSLAEERAPYTFRRLVNGKVTWKYDPVARDDFTRAEPPPFIGANPPEVWEKIRCPILFVLAQGGGNGLSLEQARDLVQYGNGSRWVEVPNTSHWIHEENLDGFIQALQPFFEQSYGA